MQDATLVAGAVISTGGGAVREPLSRWTLWHHGTVAWLELGADELLRRLAADPVRAPDAPAVQPRASVGRHR